MVREDKERILVVLPYGMCFRNIVLNEDLWGNLRDSYTIDVLTPLEIPEKNARPSLTGAAQPWC